MPESKPTDVAEQKSAQVVWKQCLDIIRDNINNQQSFKTWFEPIIPVKLQGEELTIQVPSQFFYEWIEENYYTLLKRTIIDVIGRNAKLTYSVIVQQSPIEPVTVKLPQQPVEPSQSREIRTARLANDLYRGNIHKYESYLNPKYVFESFIKGDCNSLAYAAAKSIAETPGKNQFNPLVLYGGVGLGKTHLAQAIGNAVRAKQKAEMILYVSCEKFTLDFITAIQTNRKNEFSGFYRNVDLLIIDDIQFFADKEKTQEEVFHIFNTLHQANKQIVLTCDRPIKDLRGLEERLISRFAWGLPADVQPPDLETRLAILQKKIEDNGAALPSDVVHFIATNVVSNIRELEGCLIKLMATASLHGRDIDLPLAKSVLKDIIRDRTVNITFEMIEKVVCDYYKLSLNDLKGKSRKQELALARQIAMFLGKTLTNSSFKTIGLHFGGRDHSTVIHAVNAIERGQESSPQIKKDVEELKKRLEIMAL
jgi:chromosomal replication initiator protein